MYVKEGYIIQSVSSNFVVILRRNYLSETLEEAQNFSNWSLQTISGKTMCQVTLATCMKVLN